MTQHNVLLIVLDAVRKDHLTPYGYGRPTTPNLADFASSGTRYDDAVAAAPWTPSSHGALFSGKYPSSSGIYGRTPQYGEDQPHVAELFARRGYDTFGFSNSYHTSPDRGFDRGFDYYHDILSLPRLFGKMYEPSVDYLRHLIDYFGRGYDDSSFQLRRLRTRLRRSDEPFFGFINLNSAHSPYDPPDRFRMAFEANFEKWDSVDDELANTVSEDAYRALLDDVEVTSAEWGLLKCWYDGELRYLDFLLGSFFDFLRDRNLLDDTMIVVTSDHGEQFGEDGLVYHQFSLSEILINVPLIIKWPNQRDPETSDELVSLVDLAPTMLDCASGDTGPAVDGRSLISDGEPEAVYAEYAGPNDSLQSRFVAELDDPTRYIRGLQAIRTGDHKLVEGTDGSVRLYDVSGNTETEIFDEAVVDTLGATLDATLGALPDSESSEELDFHVEDHLREMGYL